MIIVASVAYFFLLGWILFVSKFSSSKYLEKISQRINAMIVFHSLFVPIGLSWYCLQRGGLLDVTVVMDVVCWCFIGMTISYSIVSSICYMKYLDRRDKDILIHHGITIVVFTYALFMMTDLPMFWSFIIISQLILSFTILI